jgi:hypothetical protein
MINYTYTDAENVSRRPIDPGEYRVKIKGFEFGMAKTGTDKLDLTLVFPDIDNELIESVFFTAKSQWKFDLVLKCFGPSKKNALPEKGTEITVNEDFVTKYLLGAIGRVTVDDEEYPLGSGNTRSRVKAYHPDETIAKPVKMTVGKATQQANEMDDDEGIPF